MSNSNTQCLSDTDCDSVTEWLTITDSDWVSDQAELKLMSNCKLVGSFLTNY